MQHEIQFVLFFGGWVPFKVKQTIKWVSYRVWAPGVWHVSQPGLPHAHLEMLRMSSEHLQVMCYRHALPRGDTGTQRHHTSCSPSPQKRWRKKMLVSGRSGNTAWAAGWLVGWKRQTCQSKGFKK